MVQLGCKDREPAALRAAGFFFTCGAALPEAELKAVWESGLGAPHSTMSGVLCALLGEGLGPAGVWRCITGISCRTWAAAELVRTPGLVEALCSVSVGELKDEDKGMLVDGVTNLLQSIEKSPTEDEAANTAMTKAGRDFLRKAR